MGGRPLHLSRQETPAAAPAGRARRAYPLEAPYRRRLYGFGEEVSSNSVEVHVHNLRQALRRAGAQAAIETRRGVGYRLGKKES